MVAVEVEAVEGTRAGTVVGVLVLVLFLFAVLIFLLVLILVAVFGLGTGKESEGLGPRRRTLSAHGRRCAGDGRAGRVFFHARCILRTWPAV